MPDPFVSYAQNGEDVVLWRALGHIERGRYVDVGAMDASADSVTKAFYLRGWRGLNIEPVPEYARALAEARPDDEVLEAAITHGPSDTVVLHQVADSGLSTVVDEFAERHREAGFEVKDIVVPAMSLTKAIAGSGMLGGEVHLLKIDVEGAEGDVLASLDLDAVRPWVIVVESTEPRTNVPTHEAWEQRLLSAGYEFCLFDGLSRFYVSAENADLKPRLSYPACVLDGFVRADLAILHTHVEELTARLEKATADRTATMDDTRHWRSLASTNWSEFVEAESNEREMLRQNVTFLESQTEAQLAHIAELERRLRGLEGGRRADRAMIARQKRAIAELHASTSWRVTRLIRVVGGFGWIRRIRRRPR